MRRLSKVKKDRIVNLLFSGKTYREIVTKEDVSLGMISKTLKEFIGATDESSIREAAAKYNVADVVDRLLELTREVEETKVSLQNLISAARLYRLMKARGLNASQLENYLKMCDKHRGDLPDFASKATEFYLLEERTGKPYEYIVEDVSKKVKERRKLRGEIAELEKKRTHAGKDLERTLAKNDLTKKEIPFASALKETLCKHRFTIEDTSKIPRFLREIEACRGNVKIFLERAEQAKDLKWEVFNLKDEKKHLLPVVETIKKEGLELQDKRDQLRGKVESLETTKQKLQEEIRSLKAEASTKSNEIRLTKCVIRILRSKPADFNVLYEHLSMWKHIMQSVDPQLISRKLQYEESVRKAIVNTFLEYFEDDLAPKEEVTKLQEALQEKDVLTSDLSGKLKGHQEQIEQLQLENRKLRDENKKLTRKIETLEKDVQDLEDRMLRDPTVRARNVTWHDLT